MTEPGEKSVGQGFRKGRVRQQRGEQHASAMTHVFETQLTVQSKRVSQAFVDGQQPVGQGFMDTGVRAEPAVQVLKVSCLLKSPLHRLGVPV